MKFMRKLTNERFARLAARVMQFACYIVIFFYALCTVLSFMGRQAFTLRTHAETFERAIYAEEDHADLSRGLIIHSGDDIHVRTNDQDQIDPITHLGLSLIYAFHSIPMIFAYRFLSRVFSNIRKGKIFTEQNSLYLLYYGILQFSVALFVPFIKLMLCWLVNLVTSSPIGLATGKFTLIMLAPSIAFIVAAYIIHYGVHLQDEVDHTL